MKTKRRINYKKSVRIILCEICGRQRTSWLKGRDICTTCYQEESSTLCSRCGRMRRAVDVTTGLCPHCAAVVALPEPSCDLTYGRRITCEVCGLLRYTNKRNRDICLECYRREGSVKCKRCQRMKHLVAQATGLCPRCTEIVSRRVDRCSRCDEVTSIYNSEELLCLKCHQAVERITRRKANAVEVRCSGCGKRCISMQARRSICHLCMKRETNGEGICSTCGKTKVIHNKSKHLCMTCYQNSIAPKALQRYVSSFTSPFPYNKELFDYAASTIDWPSVTERVNEGFRRFGRFLQEREFENPLSWDQIEEALPALSPANRNVPKQIRGLLLRVGDVLAGCGKLESREAYTLRRFALNPIQKSPENIRKCLQQYTRWLTERGNSFHTVRQHLQTLAQFWLWCDGRGVMSPNEVQRLHVKEFLQTRYRRWLCVSCSKKDDGEVLHLTTPATCFSCGCIHQNGRVQRITQESVRHDRAILKLFFGWAKKNHMVLANPVIDRIPPPERVIQHYPYEIIERLYAYCMAPDSDPEEALVLFLLITYAFTAWELRHAQIPVLSPLSKDTPTPPLAEIYGILLPKRPPTRGVRSPGRADELIRFRDQDSAWLKLLLERFERSRLEKLKKRRSCYLLVAPGRHRNNCPVNKHYVYRVVERASLRQVGAVCNPSTLRKTVAISFTDKSSSAVLSWMGWARTGMHVYDWAVRKEINPRMKPQA